VVLPSATILLGDVKFTVVLDHDIAPFKLTKQTECRRLGRWNDLSSRQRTFLDAKALLREDTSSLGVFAFDFVFVVWCMLLLPLLSEFVHFITQSANFVANLVELLHDFANWIAFVMSMLFLKFPLSRFGSRGYVVCDVVQASVMKMFYGNSHVF